MLGCGTCMSEPAMCACRGPGGPTEVEDQDGHAGCRHLRVGCVGHGPRAAPLVLQEGPSVGVSQAHDGACGIHQLWQPSPLHPMACLTCIHLLPSCMVSLRSIMSSVSVHSSFFSCGSSASRYRFEQALSVHLGMCLAISNQQGSVCMAYRLRSSASS